MINKIYNKLIYIRNMISSNILTMFVYMKCNLIGIKINSKCIFYGWPIIFKNGKSTIKIGYACRFRSRRRMNLQAGIVRPCSVETLGNGSLIEIGDNCGFSGTMISAAKCIIIGNNVLCGANTSITDTDWHGILSHQRASSFARRAPVVIEDNVLLGMNVIVLKGSHIGMNSIISANSVVTGRIPSNVIARGNPAIVIKEITNI